LDLWSYPNTFIDKRSAPGAGGKELADLLVVCGDDVIIFSDKSIAWPPSDDVHLGWSRWYRRAVKKSVDQIRGAEQWLRDHPDRIFLDPACTKKLPIELPPTERRRVHGIAVALGAQEACSVYFSDQDGSLMIFSHLKGSAHVDSNAQGYMPFAFGDVDPEGPFVHVFDETALSLVMREMDTVSDFVRYLSQRELAIRRGHILHAPGEAELLAVYLDTLNDTGAHVFPTPEDFGEGSDAQIVLPAGQYDALVRGPDYLAKKRADKPSYVWDKLIRVFTEHIIAGTSVAVAGELPSASMAEPALRMMARENRVVRRALGSAFIGALEEADLQGKIRFARVVTPNELFADPYCGYVFLVLAYPTAIELEEGYAQYRRTRVAMLRAYCAVTLYDHRELKRMVGIAVDASSCVTGREGGSESRSKKNGFMSNGLAWSSV
jgi:hypothetical protein